MKSMLFLLGVGSIIYLASSAAFAATSCDFDQDGKSELVFVNVASSGKYDWTAFNPRSGKSKIVAEDFGDQASKLIPGNWISSDQAVAGIVDPVSGGVTGRAKWAVQDSGYTGESYLHSLGRSGDLIIQGGDYDGNGITDSLILKQSTGKLGLRVNYFLSSYNGNNLGKERLYKALGSPFHDANFFFSPDGVTDYLGVLRIRGQSYSALQLKPFTDSPKAFSLGTIPNSVRGALPLKQGVGQPDLLAFFAPGLGSTKVFVKKLSGATIFTKTVPGSDGFTVGDYFADRGWEIAVRDGDNFHILNPLTRSEHVVTGPGGKLASCVGNQFIN